jgi:NAD(P)H dehydrogenase (quinone)
MRIVITGANGEVGRGVLEAVAARLPEADLVATVRDTARAADLVARGIDVGPGNFDDPDILRDSFAGADLVFVNATFFGAEPEVRGRLVANAIRAAAGASRIVLTSWPDVENAALPHVSDFAKSERLLREAGPAWTILRLGYGIADALAREVNWAREDGELVAPAGDARATPASVTDLIDAAATTVIETGHENACYEITGPRAIGWSDLAALAGSLDDRLVRYRAVDDDEYRAYLAPRELPDQIIDSLLAFYAEFRSGWYATPTPVLGNLIGREPVDSLEAVRQRLRS